jgi:hypothetical protein
MNVHLNNINPTHPSTGTESQVLVFKTNLRFKKDVRQVGILLGQEPGILRWNVDLWDVDKVLRIETTRLSVQEVIALVTGAGYCCSDLPD